MKICQLILMYWKALTWTYFFGFILLAMIDPSMPYLLFRLSNNYQLKNLFLRAVLIVLWSYYHYIFTELCNIVVCVGFLFIFTTRDILQKCR